MYVSTEAYEPIYLSWQGKPAVKKNTQQIAWAGFGKLGYKGKIAGLKGFFGIASSLAHRNPRFAATLLLNAQRHVRPFILPNSDFKKAVKEAAEQVSYRGPALGSRTEPVEVKAVFHLGPKTSPDLDNLWTAMLDILQELGVVKSDYWVIRPHGETHRRRCNPKDPEDVPRTQVWVWRRPDLRNELAL